MPKAIVTGGLGFVGKSVVKRFMKDNLEVIVAEIPGVKIPSSLSSVVVEEVDITDRENVFEVFSKHNSADYVVHLAAYANVREAQENPKSCVNINILGTLNVIDAAINIGVERFIYMSSSAVYGVPKEDIITENYPTRPINNYGLSKLTGENALMMHNDLNKIILRGANIYGPGQKNLLIPTWMKCVVSNESPKLNSEGQAIRDYVYVDDIADAISKALTVDDHEEIYNLGTGEGTTIKMIWDMLSDAFKGKGYSIPDPILGQMTSGEVDRMVLSGTLAKESLMWEPKVNLRDGIYKTVDSFLIEHYR